MGCVSSIEEEREALDQAVALGPGEVRLVEGLDDDEIEDDGLNEIFRRVNCHLYSTSEGSEHPLHLYYRPSTNKCGLALPAAPPFMRGGGGECGFAHSRTGRQVGHLGRAGRSVGEGNLQHRCIKLRPCLSEGGGRTPGRDAELDEKGARQVSRVTGHRGVCTDGARHLRAAHELTTFLWFLTTFHVPCGCAVPSQESGEVRARKLVLAVGPPARQESRTKVPPDTTQAT